jgi:hypothetical protein
MEQIFFTFREDISFRMVVFSKSLKEYWWANPNTSRINPTLEVTVIVPETNLVKCKTLMAH